MTSVPQPDAERERLSAEMDRLSLEQALIDFEVANKRVVDLTNRLVEALEENRVLKRRLELMHVRHFIATRARGFGPVRAFMNIVGGRKTGA